MWRSRCGLAFAVLVWWLAGFPAQAQTQGEMNQEAYRDFQAADKALNAAYAKALKALPDDEAREKLKTAQRAWLAYRDAEAECEADFVRGGTMAPLERACSLKALTEDRTKEIQALVKSYSP